MMKLSLLKESDLFWDETFLKQISSGGELEFSPKKEMLMFNGNEIKTLTDIIVKNHNENYDFKGVIKNTSFSKAINLKSLLSTDEENEESFGNFIQKIARFYVEKIMEEIKIDKDYIKAYKSLISLSKFLGVKVFNISGTEYPAIPIGVLFSDFDNKETLQKIENSNPSYLNPVDSGLDSLQYEVGLLIVERQSPGVLKRYGVK